MKRIPVAEFEEIKNETAELLKGNNWAVNIPLPMAEQNRYKDIRWSLLCETAENGIFLESIGLVDITTTFVVRLNFSKTRQNWISFYDQRQSNTLPETVIRSSGLKKFALEGIKGFVSLKKTDDMTRENHYLRLSEIAECYNGKAIPIKNPSESQKGVACIGPDFSSPIIDTKTLLLQKVFSIDAPTSKIKNAIIIKNFFYRLNKETLLKSMSIVRGPIECIIEKGIHVIELDPYIDERYLAFLFFNFSTTDAMISQLIHFSKTYNKITITDLERILVQEPTGMIKTDEDVINFHSNLQNKLLELKNANPNKKITHETVMNACLDI